MTTVPSSHLRELPNRISSIDALRGLAALSVLLFHAHGAFWIGLFEAYHRYGLQPNFNAWLGYLSEPMSYGFLGVNLFFVLSGYCIHRRGAQLLAKDPNATLDWWAFAVRRFWRIYPTYIAALILTGLVNWWIAEKQGLPHTAPADSLYTFFISLLTLEGYCAPYFGDNVVFWTLAIEVHLYIAYPILFALSRRYGPRKAVLTILFIALAYIAADRLIGIESHFPYRSVQGPVFLPYWFTWAMGFYIAEIQAHRTRDFAESTWRWLMAIGLICGLPQVLHGTHPESADIFWALFFAGLLRWSIKSEHKALWSGWLGTGLAAIGVFSYSLYATHAPMLKLFHALIASDDQKFGTLWPTLAASGFAIAVAWIFFQLVERWSLRPAKTSASAQFIEGGQHGK